MRLKNEKFVKGLVFAGCSFTWGQGLNYYNNFPTNIEMPLGRYDKTKLTASHVKYIKKHRFPRLVADHFNTYEFVRWDNGGSNQEAVEWFRGCFTQVENLDTPEANIVYGKKPMRIDYSEISHVIFQLTQLDRDSITLEINGKMIKDGYLQWISDRKDQLSWYLDEHNLDFDLWCKERLQDSFNNVKNFLMECEDKGIQAIVTTWPWENNEYIQRDSWMCDRLLPITYKNETYYSFHDMVGGNGYDTKPPVNAELLINFDYENFIEPPTDMHISKLGHKVIADNIIAYIENKGRNYL